ncbi:ankyrin repeat domain-containing protein [Nibribacter koreensis]|uniref:Ankyrin repeat-containing protein n=1 Tax=Nibribacter koreensis TaxID=1084519 RepID=A0ABP8FDG8_9BACT
MKTTWGILILCAALCTTLPLYAQTGPWAKYDQELKDGALYREASQGNLEEVKSIVAGGGNIHYLAPQTKSTILMAAAGSGKIEVVKYLLDQGADPSLKDWWNYTALDKARSVGAKDIEALLQAKMAGKQPSPVVEPKPQPDKPKEDTAVPAPKPQPKPAPTPLAPNKWPMFGSYAVGDSILYWVPTGWRRGVVAEVGVKEATGRVSVDYSHKKYLIDPDAYALGNDWYEWSGVVTLQRKPFWTNWFIGDWQLGEVQAHSNEVKGNKETDTYYLHKASEKLQVFANKTYRWQLTDGKVVTGKWKSIPNEPGIVLLKAFRGFDWTLRNLTGVHDWSIRKLDKINLKPNAQVMSINGQRKSTE